MRAPRLLAAAAATALSLSLSLTLSLSACGGDAGGDPPTHEAPAATDAFPVTIEHAYGETAIEGKPERVATVAWANHEVPLALGLGVEGEQLVTDLDEQVRDAYAAHPSLAGKSVMFSYLDPTDLSQVGFY